MLNSSYRHITIRANACVPCRAKLSTPVAKSTLSEEIKKRGIQYRKAVRISALSPLHIAKRMEWCRKMRGQDWSKVFFTDECSI